MTGPDDLAVYVVNLPRRPDRRTWMQEQLPPELDAVYTSDWHTVIDGRELSLERLAEIGVGLHDWQIESDNPWWARPLKFGEISCTLAHLACWEHFAAHTRAPYCLILEDDAVLGQNLLDRLQVGIRHTIARTGAFDLLYLGRDPLEPDTPSPIPGIVRPGYSHCTYAYLLTRDGAEKVLNAGLRDAIIPVDEFLPAMYTPHPRFDLRARFAARLSALAFDPPLATQRPKGDAGSDTEDTDFIEADESAEVPSSTPG